MKCVRQYYEFCILLEVKGEGKIVTVLPLTEHRAMKAHWGSG
jgi:hypothetical protein